MKIMFMIADNYRIAGTKQGEKSRIGFKASLYHVKLTICKRMRRFHYIYLLRKKVVNISFSLFALK